MARGVPLDLPDEDLTAAVNSNFPGCLNYRLRTTAGIPLRTVKLEFPNRELLEKAINNGLLIESHHLLLRVEYPHANFNNVKPRAESPYPHNE